jgi:hypothetical protein
MSNLFIKFIRVDGGMKSMKHFNGSASYGSLRTSGIVSDYRLHGRRRQKICPLASEFRPALRLTQLPIQWVQG